MKWFKRKRRDIAKDLPKNSVLILTSWPRYFRQTDVAHPYRQSSNFYYLTGFTADSALFLLFPSGKSILFIPDKNLKKEIWDGELYSPLQAQNTFLIDKVYPLSQLHKLKTLLKSSSKFFYESLDPYFNKQLKKIFTKYDSASQFLTKFRRIKDSTELAYMQKAIDISIYAHKNLAKALKPNVSENALHGIFLKSIMEKGAKREAYGSICACGKNATTLHYVANQDLCRKNELLLVDAGAEYKYYSADITRVYPVNGTFTKNQKILYQKLLTLQKSLIQKVRPNISLKTINQDMIRGIIRILMQLDLLKKDSIQNHEQKKTYIKYCPHSVGHLLGLDVHDVSFLKTEQAILKPGMVLTIEPGIYISKNDKTAKKDLKAVGLRIEDDILVTTTGHKNLTKNLTKELLGIEKLCSL